MPEEVAADRRDRAQRRRDQPFRLGAPLILPDPDTDLGGYLADLRRRMREETVRFLRADAWLGNRKAHLFAAASGDEFVATRQSEQDPRSDHFRSERLKAAMRVETLSAAIVAELACSGLDFPRHQVNH